ncbi:MAG: helix-turn-helix domain-containing protein [Syntrophothermus sp.]|uniref:helix-turn-helix domain-containing protein n=1 Tax=Syntrophothermus sp. TaxID=2736299 RepID=UPI00257DCC33|nr:helix-turn-helix transcriptional regulator [Syntrophothermus sp.]NSW82760.1 helix-turn-helix domain-containing protein [Syntrophothermus sp.]
MQENNNFLRLDEVRERFSRRLKQLRTMAGLTQQDLADLLSVNRAYISMLENGDLPSIETLCQLANIFQCSTDYLLGFDRRRRAIYETEVPVIDGYRVGKPLEVQNVVGSVIVHKGLKADFGITIKHNWYTSNGILRGDVVLIRFSNRISERTNMVFAQTTHSVRPRIFFIQHNENGSISLIRPRGRPEAAEPEVVSINDPGVKIVGVPVGIIRMFAGKRQKGEEE